MTSRISEDATNSVKGSLVLFFGNSIALLLNAASSILVASMLTPSEYGLFTLSLVLPTFFKLFTDWGVDQALVRNIAKERSLNITSNIKDIVWTGLGFKFLVSGTLSLVLFLFADVFTTFVLKRPDLGEYVRLASLLVISQTIYSTALSILTGFEKMDKRAHLNIIHALGKSILSPLFVYMGYGVNGVVLGHFMGSLFPSLIGLWIIKKLSRDFTLTKVNINRIWTTLDYGAPLFIGNIVLGMAGQFRGFLLSWFVPDDVIGNFGVASWFSTFVVQSFQSFGIALFPAFSKYDIQTKPIKMNVLFQSSIRYLTMFSIPLILLLISVSRPIIYILFGEKYPLVSFYLSLLLIPSLFIGIGSMSIFRFLNSQGDTRTTMIIKLPTSILRIILAGISIYLWNIEGLLISFIISVLIQNIYSIIILYKKYNILPDFNHTLKTLLGSIISGGLTYSTLLFLSALTPLLKLIISIGIFVLSYLIIAPFIGAITMKDIHTIDAMLKNVKPIYFFARKILDVEEKILKIYCLKD